MSLSSFASKPIEAVTAVNPSHSPTVTKLHGSTHRYSQHNFSPVVKKFRSNSRCACDTSGMRLNLSADEVLTTTRAVRKRLDLDRPVEHSIVMECLEIALQAPSASNRQFWQWMFVEDADKKRALGDIYRDNRRQNNLRPRTTYPAGDPRGAADKSVAESADYLAENFHRVPLLLIPCAEGKPDTVNGAAAFWGSFLPAVWSFNLALRERGLGSAWTTTHLVNGGEQRAAELLGIPDEGYTQAGLFPIAYTKGTDFRRASSRLPASQVAHWDRW